MTALIGADGGPVTDIASRCSHFGVRSRVEIDENVLAALPVGGRFEDAAKTGVSKNGSGEKKGAPEPSFIQTLTFLKIYLFFYARPVFPAQTLRKKMVRSVPPMFQFIWNIEVSNVTYLIHHLLVEV